MEKRLEAHRLFVAILPPPDVIQCVAGRRDTLAQKSPILDEHLHITMGLLPDMKLLDERVVESAKAALSSVSNGPVHVCLDRISSNKGFTGLRPGEKSAALAELQRRIARAFANARLPFADRWSFNPHMTLFRSGVPRPEEEIDAISWRADDIALVHSLVGLTRHIVLHRVMLTD